MAAGVAAIRRLNGQCVVAADVTLRACRHFTGGSHLVRIRQREARGAVIKLAVRPNRDGVAGGACRRSRREVRGHVIRHVSAQRLGAVPRRQVAAHAVRVRRSQSVIAADVAQGAGCRGVGADQCKARGAVVKLAVRPVDHVVAGGALRCREARGNVIRNIAAESLRAGPGRLVAAVAIRVRRGKCVVVVDVAVGAGVYLAGRCQLVRARQRPAGRGVVKRGIGPRNRIVTGRTVGRRESRARSGVRRVIRGLPGGEVAAGVAAIRRLNGQCVVAADMALRASRNLAGGRHLVRIRQREARGAVIKLAVGPDRDGVARGAGRSGSGEVRSHVIGHVSAQRLGAVPGRQVAAHAIRIGGS